MSEYDRETAGERSREATGMKGRDGMEGMEGKKKTFVERVELTGSELVDRVKELIEDGNARRIIVRDRDGEELLEAPLTFGVVAGGLITVAAPLLAALGALAALVSRVKLEVIREVDEEAADASAADSTRTEVPHT